MLRLVKHGLMFGNLIEVRAPALVARYNRALKHLTGKETALPDFHIDISGYSPEIGDEFGDDLYLNPHGVNRQFILLTIEQKTAPLLNAQFSTSHDILRGFIEDNEEQLFALTAREAVAGEVQNSVYRITRPADLLDIQQISVEADTVQGHVEQSRELATMIKRFNSEPDAWFDDVLIADMIETAKTTGNIMRDPITLKSRTTRQGNFYTKHFGGLYVFRDTDLPAAIAPVLSAELAQFPMEHVLGFHHANQIANFLEMNGLAEPLVNAKGRDVAAILQQKLDFMLISSAADQDVDLGGMDRRDIRRLVQRRDLSGTPGLETMLKLIRYAQGTGRWPRITSEDPAYFYTLRAADTPEKDLVNQLLADLTPLDFRQLFICHKEAFYAAYRGWSESKKDFVARFLAEEYALDKAGVREELYGHEAPMDAPEPKPARPKRDELIARVGPWGAVRRR